MKLKLKQMRWKMLTLKGDVAVSEIFRIFYDIIYGHC